MPDVLVPVAWVGQEEVYYCGPAVAQMTLASLGANPPNAAQGSWQTQLWAEIQAQTGAVRPKKAGSGSASNPAFPTQECEQCPGDPYWNCWSTTPRALMRVLNDDQTAANFTVSLCIDNDRATAALLQAIDEQIPGVALVDGWGHWVVVDGYVHDEPSPYMVAGRALNSVYIRDPDESASLHLVTCQSWLEDYLSFVPCGEWENKVVVISSTRPPSRPPAHLVVK